MLFSFILNAIINYGDKYTSFSYYYYPERSP